MSAQRASEQRRAERRIVAEATREQLTGAWLAVRPRRHRFEVRQILILDVDPPDSSRASDHSTGTE